MRFEIIFVTLFSVAAAVALIARWLKVPYTIALVVAGLLLGTAHALEPPHLTKHLLFTVFLPGLIFEAAFHLDFNRFWRNKLAISALAVPGLVASIALTALLFLPAAHAFHFIDGLRLEHALVFAALISATDPIAVVALFKRLGVPKRLSLLIESESLLNDGTAVVLFTLVLAYINGQEMSALGALIDFIRVVGIGALIGIAIGVAASKVIQRVDDPMIEITLTTIAAYGSFILAESLHSSGIIATVAAGMLCGNYGARTGMTPTTRFAVETFWEYVAFALNSIVFLLIGFEVRITSLLHSLPAILFAYLSVTLVRTGVVFLISLFLRRSAERIPWSWSVVLTWGGLRGGLSMVLVLALAPDFPMRSALVTITFGVVILSILIQGLSMSPLLRWMGLFGKKKEQVAYEIQRSILRAKTAALQDLDGLQAAGALHADTVKLLREEYATELAQAERAMRDLHIQAADLQRDELDAARRQLILVEKSTVLDARQKGLISQDAFDQLLASVNLRLVRLEKDGA